MKIIKDFDLLSPKWLDIAFEKKNKQYGAYELRNDSSNRHLKALIIVCLVGLLAVFLPKIVSTMTRGDKEVKQEEGVKITEFQQDDQPDDAPPPADVAPPPPPELQQTVKFDVAVITKDELVQEENLLKAQDELAKLDDQIAAENVEGKKEGGVNIDDVKLQKEIVKPDSVYVFVPVKARFPGGEAALNRWLSEHINYPIVAQENNVQGNVFVRFVVRPDGRIDGVEVVKKVHPSLDNEAIRVLKDRDMPRWQAGENQHGQKVSSYFTLPVKFILK